MDKVERKMKRWEGGEGKQGGDENEEVKVEEETKKEEVEGDGVVDKLEEEERRKKWR